MLHILTCICLPPCRPGSFLLRKSDTTLGDFALAFRTAKEVRHWKIVSKEQKYFVYPRPNPYNSLEEIVAVCCVCECGMCVCMVCVCMVCVCVVCVCIVCVCVVCVCVVCVCMYVVFVCGICVCVCVCMCLNCVVVLSDTFS